MSAMAAVIAAWRSVPPRGWLLSLAAGLVFAAAQTLHNVSPQLWNADRPAALPALALIRWSVLVGLLALAIRFGVALIDAVERQRPLRGSDHVALVAALTAFGLLVADQAAYAVLRLVRPALVIDAPAFWDGPSWVEGLVLGWTVSIPTVVVLAILGPMVHAQLRRAAEDERRLASAQLRLAEVQRRVLAAELSGAQAMVDPRFLFGTLSAVQQHFSADPARAGGLLDALIRYLRAAMPAHPEAGSTLGEQAELVRAWLTIERLRLPHRLQAQVEAPAALASRPFSPLLLVPLVAEAVRRQLGDDGAGRVELRIALEGLRLVVAVDVQSDDGRHPDRPAPVPAELQARVTALYGADARLEFDGPTPRRTHARLDIADPGEP
jgi:hypothetical protein